MQIKGNTSIHPGKISLGVGRYDGYKADYYYDILLIMRNSIAIGPRYWLKKEFF